MDRNVTVLVQQGKNLEYSHSILSWAKIPAALLPNTALLPPGRYGSTYYGRAIYAGSTYSKYGYAFYGVDKYV